jgi:hypothetical protein
MKVAVQEYIKSTFTDKSVNNSQASTNPKFRRNEDIDQDIAFSRMRGFLAGHYPKLLDNCITLGNAFDFSVVFLMKEVG